MAASSILYIAVASHNSNAQSVLEKALSAPSDDPSQGIQLLMNYLARCQGGTEIARVYAMVDDGAGTAASGTIACTQANATNGETCVIAGVTFTIASAVDADPRAGIVVAGATNTTFASSLKDQINLHPLLNKLVVATSSTGTVTVTFHDKGLHGNLLAMSETGDAFVVTDPTNGAEGVVVGHIRAFSKGA